MRLVRTLVARAALVLAALAGAGTVAMMVMICTDVVLRAFGRNFPGTLEYVTYYLMVMVAYLPVAQIERRDQMISVDSLYTIMPRGGKLVMSAFVAVGLTFTYAVIAYVTWLDALVNYARGSFIYAATYLVPVWPAYFIVPLAFALATVVLALRIVDVFRGELPEETPEAGGGMSVEVNIKAGTL